MEQETMKQYILRKGKGMLIYTIVFLVIAALLQMCTDRFETIFYVYMICVCIYIASFALGFQPSQMHFDAKKRDFWEKGRKKRELPTVLDILFAFYTLILPFVYSSIIGLK